MCTIHFANYKTSLIFLIAIFSSYSLWSENTRLSFSELQKETGLPFNASDICRFLYTQFLPPKSKTLWRLCSVEKSPKNPAGKPQLYSSRTGIPKPKTNLTEFPLHRQFSILFRFLLAEKQLTLRKAVVNGRSSITQMEKNHQYLQWL